MLLLGLATAAFAQSLGDARAEAWIGQPLLVTVPAGMEVSGKEDCVHADVFYGDSRVGASQVRASLVGQGSSRRVRIEADQPIDEPVVTVSVRAGCHNTMTRSYTLLPELPSAAMLAAANVAPVVPFQANGRVSRAVATQVAGASAARSLRTADNTPRTRTRPAAASIVKVRQPRMIQVAATTSGPRLRLENWEPDPQTMLRVSSYLASPVQDGAVRATAALLWQALNVGPEQVLRTSATLQQLEGELAQLRQTAGQTQNEMMALRRELETPPVFGLPARAMQLLALVLALAAATAAFLWYRAARGGPGQWSGAPLDSVLDGLAAAPQPAGDGRMAPQAPARRLMPEPAADTMQRSPVAAAPAARPRPAMQVRAPSATMMRVETLSATFEEVDFLASLGLWNDAMDILKTYLEDSAAPAPLAYYELMRLCVNTDDAASLVQVRKRYAQVFGVESPKFEQINAPIGVEGYPELSNRISGAWGTAEAQDFIELSLFTVAPAGKACSLQAGRDLLFLHDLAMALGRESGLGIDAEGDLHALAPWARSDDPEQVRLAAQASGDATGGHRFGLDLDLSVTSEPVADSMPAPLELVPPKPPRAPIAPVAPVAADPFATGASPLNEDHDPFSAAVASERIRRT
ncbi:MAG: hypothetical protein JWQ76_4244 [Ramlibacter sp.]|nr:hypothetical protein [Ramlibacter sp.]